MAIRELMLHELFRDVAGQNRCPYYLVRLPVAVGCPYSVVQTSERVWVMGVPAWLVCKNLIAIKSKYKLNHRRATPNLEEAGAWPVLSLFSGAGGFDLGFKQAGFKRGSLWT